MIEVDDDLAWMDAPKFRQPTALERQIIDEATDAVCRGQVVVLMRDGKEIRRLMPDNGRGRAQA